MQLRPGSRERAWFARDVVTSVDSSGERVLLHLPSGTYLGLDRSAAVIVDLLNENPDEPAAALALVEKFGIPYDRALGDVGAVVAAVQGMTAPRVNRGRKPTVAGVRVVALSWWRLSWSYRWTTAQATLALMAIEAGLKFVDVTRLARWMGVPLAMDQAAPPTAGPDDLRTLTGAEERAYWALGWVLARWLYDGTCLRRSLALGWFLRRRHPVLRLGMIDDAGVVAHAWIEIEGHAFNAQQVVGTFALGTSGSEG